MFFELWSDASIIDSKTIESWLVFVTGIWPLLLMIPIVIISVYAKIWPTGRAVLLFFISIFFSLFFFLFDIQDGYQTIRIIDFMILLLLLLDMATVAFTNPFQVHRRTERVASLAREHQVFLKIENHGRFNRRVWITDDVIESLDNKGGAFLEEELIPANNSLELDYKFIPLVRGAFQLEAIWLFVFSLIRLWKRELKLPEKTDIHVYPDLRQISQYELLARTQRLHQLGFRKTRRIGLDNDFERLRDYTPDDQYKFIDWKATARRNKLIVKDFQMNRSQRIIFMIDSGRMMMNQVKGLSFLDYAFNSMLMLSYIALKQGDEVGFICFSEEVRQFIVPKPGLLHMNHLIHGSFNIFPEPVESRYDQAFAHLETHCRKRSLLVLITNIIDERNSTQISEHLCKLTGKHLPLALFLKDHTLFDPLNSLLTADKEYISPVSSTDALLSPGTTDLTRPGTDQLLFGQTVKKIYRMGAAAEILNWRYKVLKELSARGTLTLDLFPENITAPLINKYLEVKARHLL